MQKILHEEEEKNDFDHQTFLLERKKDRKISLFLPSSLLLLLLLRVEIEVVKVARVVVGRRSAAVDFDDVWWSFSVVASKTRERYFFFFLFFLCDKNVIKMKLKTNTSCVCGWESLF